jgi:polyhydroxybutyrate depolymerase
MIKAGLKSLLPLCCVFLCAQFAQAQQATHVIMVKVGDDYRSVQLHIPAGHDGETPLPLVFNLHGTGGSAERQEKLTAMSTIADEEQFLLVGGMAVYKPHGPVTWNAILDPDGVNDIDYISAAIDAVDRKVPVDRKQIFATGMSGGGRMSSRIACELSDQIAAVAPVAGVQFGANCNPLRPIPLLTFHGLADTVNTYSGEDAQRNPFWVAGVEEAVALWADSNGCGTEPLAKTLTAEITRLSYADCSGGADVVFFRIENAGHSWPGSALYAQRADRTTNMDIDASRLIWEFFEAHPLP